MIQKDLPAISLDVGQARIGLAACDSEGRFVFGRNYIVRTDLKSDLQAIKDFYELEKSKLIVIGLPLRTDGGDSVQTESVRVFAKSLQDLDLPIIFQDERFSTYLAGQNMRHAKKTKREKGKIDEESAIVILRTYLDRIKNNMV